MACRSARRVLSNLERRTLYRYVDAVVVRAAVSGRDCERGGWPDVTGQETGPASWRPWLQQALSTPEFAAALEQASPVLADRARAICAGRPVPHRAARRAVLSVMRYLLRSTGRATPYGLFAGVAPARVAATGAVRLGATHRAVARVSAEWVAAVVDRLETDPQLRPFLTVRANNLLIERGGQIVLAHRASRTPGGAPTHLAVRATAPVRAALTLATDPIRVQHLAKKLATDFRVGADTVNTLLADLVAQRLLLTNLRPTMTDTSPLDRVATGLEDVFRNAAAITAPRGELRDASAVRDTLREIIDHAARHDRSSSWAVAGVKRRKLAESLAVVYPTTTPAVAVDLRLDCDLVVPHVVAAEAARAAAVLVRLARPGSGGWLSWHSRFLERYGPHALVPVLEAVDPDVGLGYPAGYQGTPPTPPTALTGRDRTLLALAQNAAIHRQREIVLDDTTIAELGSDTPVTSAQPSTELTVRVHASTMDAVNRGEFTLAVIGVSRTAGTTTGRLLDLFEPGDRARIAAAYTAIPTTTRDALVAQISAATLYTVADDVARAPQVLPHLLPLGEYHDNRQGRIALTDIAVTADAHRLYLVSLSRRRLVEPLVLNAVEPVHHTLPIVRFLTEAPTALAARCTSFDWGGAASLPFLPALRHGRTIISPARWLLPAAELPGPTASWRVWGERLAAWLDAVGCPKAVYLGDGDQRIGLDLAEPAHQALLRDHLSRMGTALLRTAPAADSAGWIGRRAHEIVIPLATTIDPVPPPRLFNHTVDVRGHGHLPGCDGHVYVKVYGHPDRQTTILTRHLPSLIETVGAEDRWWFLRYGDPEPHLRLRLKLTGNGAAGAIGAWARRLRGAGLTARVQIDTDYPETARFGGPAALAAAENYLAADSAAALAQLATAGHKGVPDLLALTAASLLDIATGLIGDTTEAMHWLIGHTRPSRPAPARIVYDEAVWLANPHTSAPLAVLPEGERILSTWHHRREALTAYRDTLHAEGSTSPIALLPDLLHLHHARIAGPDPDGERTCLHLARAAALSWAARTRSQP
jgi:thiopeptide-type bacteriocin biosynthesis protein